jgi:archaellum component FlaD/FlaE
MKKDCCVVVTHLQWEEMVIDPNDYDVSELRKQIETDDTSANEDDDHGFNWVSDQENDWKHDNQHPYNKTGTSPSVNRQQPEQEREDEKTGDEETHQPEQERQQESPQNNTGPDDRDTAKFFTSHDGGRLLPQRDADEHDSQPITPTDHNSPENTDQTADSPGENDGDEEVNKEESRRERLEQMGIDPINYDLGELRTVTDHEDDGPEPDTKAHGFVWSDPPEQYRTRIEDPTLEQHRRLLTIAGIDPELVGEKPYLTTLPTEAAGSFVIDWLEFLTGEAGTEGAIDALSRYQEIGWFTERVEDDLRNNILWIDTHDGDGFCVFDQGDHLLSFAYVAKIAAVNSEGMMFY